MMGAFEAGSVSPAIGGSGTLATTPSDCSLPLRTLDHGDRAPFPGARNLSPGHGPRLFRPENGHDRGVSLPQTRPLTDTDGIRWLVTVDRGRLTLTRTDSGATVRFDRPEELRALAPQLLRAVTEHDLDVQLAAVKASHARRPTGGLRHRPFVEPPEPGLALDEAIA